MFFAVEFRRNCSILSFRFIHQSQNFVYLKKKIQIFFSENFSRASFNVGIVTLTSEYCD